jgi:hypothetical protein
VKFPKSNDGDQKSRWRDLARYFAGRCLRKYVINAGIGAASADMLRRT